jgi:hypothetical protein
MRCDHGDRLERFGVEPVVSMTKAEAADGTNLAVDHGELQFAIEWRRFDIAPSRGIEKPE